MPTPATNKDTEKRTFNFQMNVEKREDEVSEIVGHAAIFNEYTDIGWYQERIMPGAFKKSIESDDVRALFNHDPNFVIGRNKSGTLFLLEDEKGLAITIMPPDTQFARDLITLIGRGDISQMSFAFLTIKEEWNSEKNKEPDKRDLIELKLFDVSPVTYPAYPTTDVAVRSFQRWNESHIKPALSWKTGLMRQRLALKIRGGKQ